LFRKGFRERFEQGASAAREICRGHVSPARVRAGAVPAPGESLHLRQISTVILIEIAVLFHCFYDIIYISFQCKEAQP